MKLQKLKKNVSDAGLQLFRERKYISYAQEAQ
jgi:hypothetical protein